MMIDFNNTHLLVGAIAIIISLIVLWKQKRSFSYLFFFSVFSVYILGVVSVVVFPFVILERDEIFKPSINLIPFYFGSCGMINLCIRNIFDNILLTIPFGFGISFILRFRPKNLLWLAMAVGFIFEITQLIISLLYRSSFRSVDINDVILNATGVLLGYGIFRIFGWLYSYLTNKLKIRHTYIFAYIHSVVQQTR